MWRVPVVTDNVDKAIIPSLSKGKPPGSRFPVGTHEIEYTATDAADNKAHSCKFTFIVQETNCPSIKWQYKMNMSCPHKLTYGQACNFSCEHGYDMIGPDNVSCERNDSTPAVGFWSDEPPHCDGK
ncbi:hypothetical protein LSAT2_029212 [Lamellibrachia satsuma]|nr:hypothetical protein LSAT2_029212 [Lamellibrachia satsuma]